MLLADGGVATAENSGGGSGGSIFVQSDWLEFHGLVQANGGNGGESGGGGGSGGRIMFVMNSTAVALGESALFTGKYSVLGGHKGNATSEPSTVARAVMAGNETSPFDGEDGTVWTSLAPCRPGYGTVFCTVCPAGTYKIATDTSFCLPCQNAPPHALYVEEGCVSELCPYRCEVGYRGQDCLTPFDEFVRQFGGPIVLTVFVVLFVLVIFATTLITMKLNRAGRRGE